MAVDAKGKAFAEKTGRILANRYGKVIDERMEGWAVADDPDTFMHNAVLAIREELHREFYAMVEVAIGIRQGGGE